MSCVIFVHVLLMIVSRVSVLGLRCVVVSTALPPFRLLRSMRCACCASQGALLILGVPSLLSANRVQRVNCNNVVLLYTWHF